MTSYVDGEIIIFLWSILTGVVVMVLYDFFSVFTNNNGLSLFVLNIFDGIFVVCATTLTLFVFLNVSNGYIRSYEFIGALIGGILYKITLSKLFKVLFLKTFSFIFVLFNFFCKILLTPIKFMYKIIYNIIRVSSRAVLKVFTPLLRKFSLFKITLKKT